MSYPPSLLYSSSISYYNPFWSDMSVPTFSQMLSLCSVITSHVLSGQVVAVHCHAGYGRTGIVIASVLLFMDPRLTPGEAIGYVRRRRKGSVQTWRQERFVREFGEWIGDGRRVFLS